jgi:hypothetical protein
VFRGDSKHNGEQERLRTAYASEPTTCRRIDLFTNTRARVKMPSAPKVPAYYGFTDVHGFKDFLVEVLTGAPDDFMECDWLSATEQMTLDRAFEGLEYGFQLVAWEFNSPALADSMRRLASKALALYREGDQLAGQHALEEVERLLKPLETH